MRLAISTIFFFLVILPVGQTLAQDSLRILSWNVKMLPGIGKGNNRRAKAVVQQLQQQVYDVIVFQEVFQPRARKILVKKLQQQYPYQTRVLNKKTLAFKTNGGVIILSRHPIKKTKQIRYRQRQGIDRMARKGALLAEIDFKQKPVQVVGTHLQAFGTTDVMYAQYQQLHAELLKPYEQPLVPQVICGDFNTIKNLPPQLPPSVTQSMIDRLARYTVMMKTLQAEDGELLGEQQYTMDRPFNDLCKKRKEYRLLIDYCLFKSNGLKQFEMWRQVKVMRQQWHKNHRDLSDHFGLEAVVTFR